MTTNTLFESLSPKGHIEIFKVFPNGQRELLFSDHNEITNGMGIALSNMFAASSNADISRYQIGYFQMGTGTAATPFSSTVSLGAPLTSVQYGGSTDLALTSRALYNAGTNPTQVFADLERVNIVKTSPEKVKFILTLDVNTGNGLALSELGLFSERPLSLDASVLVAYRSIPAITKTSGFAITINWTIDF
tara:strand:+ start:708 stop:1280 length:573 start_codon:yes stop_codon:yes gene_type:complete